MKVPKAVETLEIIKKDLATKLEPDDLDAIQLGIEALERLQHFRNRTLFTVRSPLLHEDVEPRYPRGEASDNHSP